MILPRKTPDLAVSFSLAAQFAHRIKTQIMGKLHYDNVAMETTL